MKRSTVNILASYIDALHPIIYINHFDFKVIDDAIECAGENVKYVEMPMEFKGSVEAGDFFLYGEKEYNELYNTLSK